MSIPDDTRDLIAKLIGMLGTDNEHERATAASFLKRKLDSAKVSFGDLSELIRNGGNGRVVYVDRPVARQSEDFHNPSVEVAEKIIAKAEQRLTRGEWKFVHDIIRNGRMTGGWYRLTTPQANWLSALDVKYCTPKPKMRKAPKPGPIPESMFDDLGLTEKPARPKAKGPMPDAREDSDWVEPLGADAFAEKAFADAFDQPIPRPPRSHTSHVRDRFENIELGGSDEEDI